MLNVTVGSNTTRKSVIATDTDTPRVLFENNGIDWHIGAPYLDGRPLTQDEMDTPISSLAMSDKCYLIVTVKSDGAR